jgi:hypothetical protein
MNIDNLTRLSFEQLDEIQQRINTAISEKKNQRIEDAVTELLDLLATKFPEVPLVNILHEVAFRCEIQLGTLEALRYNLTPFSTEDGEKSTADISHPPLNLQLLVEQLKITRNSVLQNEDSRLLWLTNGGTQKTSKLFGKDLAEVLQEAIKRIERLEGNAEEPSDHAAVNADLEKIDQWAGLHLGIPLFHGTLTVISPFGARQNRTKEHSRQLQSVNNTNVPEITFPLNHRQGIQGYAAQ